MFLIIEIMVLMDATNKKLVRISNRKILYIQNAFECMPAFTECTFYWQL